jgi:hypothetical protein
MLERFKETCIAAALETCSRIYEKVEEFRKSKQKDDKMCCKTVSGISFAKDIMDDHK